MNYIIRWICVLVVAASSTAMADQKEIIELDGMIEPSVVVEMSSSVEGLLIGLKVDRSDRVKKGEIVARLESSVEKANLNVAIANAENTASIEVVKERLKFLELEEVRISDLYNKKAVPLREKEQAESNRKMAHWELNEKIEEQSLSKLRLKQAKAIHDRRLIRSPLTGVVVKRYLSAGEYVDKQPILKLAKVHPLYVETVAGIEHIGKLKVGMHAKVYSEEDRGNGLTGKLVVVDNVVDAASGTFGIRIEVANDAGKITAGLKCRVLIDPDQR